MFLITDSDFQRGGSEGFCIRHLSIPAHWKSESINTSKVRCMDGYTVMLLLENSFVMYTLLNFEFYMLNLQWCKRFVISVWATCEKTSLAYRGLNIFIHIHLFTNFLSYMKTERLCPHWRKLCCILVSSDCVRIGFDPAKWNAVRIGMIRKHERFISKTERLWNEHQALYK